MFKRTVSVITIFCLSLVLLGCGKDRTVCIGENGKDCHTFSQYGLANSSERNENVQYKVVVGNVVWSIILCETVVAPVILLGWFLYEPVGQRPSGTPKGVVK